MEVEDIDIMINRILSSLFSRHRTAVPDRILIVVNEVDRYTHTFVRAHIRDLSEDCYVLTYKHNRKTFLRNGNEIPVHTLGTRKRRIAWMFWHSNMGYEDYLIGHFIRTQRIPHVLAEFGAEGLGMLGSVHVSKSRFHVFFRGYDVFKDLPMERPQNYYPVLFSMATTCFCVSREILEYLQARGCPQEKLIWAPSGADQRFFEHPLPDCSGKKFIYYGRFVQKKAPHMLLLAMRQVVDRHPDATLIMAGAGDLKPLCEHLINYLGLSAHVSLPGTLSQDELLEEMKDCRGFVQHSMVANDGDREGTPNAVMEASAAGLPVIATRHGGIVDVVEDGITGYLVDEGDHHSMADRMCRLLEDAETSRNMGHLGRERIRQYFSKEVHNRIVKSRIFGENPTGQTYTHV